MGGSVFLDLHCPRLSHVRYDQIRKQCHEVLKHYYDEVISPPAAPEKQDHGDVDFLVARPRDGCPSASGLCLALKAVRHRNTPGSKTTHFALPIPGCSDEYAQVDVHICPERYFHWEVFLQAYGDLMQILGVLNRPLGLTANDKGLHIRIPEIEPRNRKKAMILLTSNPDEAMRFLGLDAAQYASGFGSKEEIFNWCFQGRFYGPPQMREESSNDRARLKKRPMFVTCVREWFPSNAERLFPPERTRWTREQVLSAGLSQFPAARPAYEEAMTEHRLGSWREGVLAAIRDVKPEAHEKEKTEVLRSSKRFVGCRAAEDGGEEWYTSPEPLWKDVSLYPAWLDRIRDEGGKERFLLWLAEHWAELRDSERARMRMEKRTRQNAKALENKVVTLLVDVRL